MIWTFRVTITHTFHTHTFLGEMKKKEQNDFEQVKEALTRAPVITFYALNLPTRIITDTSPTGLGAILEQQTKFRKQFNMAAENSHRYSQIEREALGVFWAYKKFHLYHL